MNALHVQSISFIPTFKRTKLADRMFEISGFRLDTVIVTLKKLKSIAAANKGYQIALNLQKKNSRNLLMIRRLRLSIQYKSVKHGKYTIKSI